MVWLEDEPELERDNPYGKALREVLYGTLVTPESIARRAVLKRIGPDVEAYTQKLFGDTNIRIVLSAVGSSLKGYAREDSDIEFLIGILAGLGFCRHVPTADYQPVFDEVYRLIEREGFQPERMMDAIASPRDYSHFTDEQYVVAIPAKKRAGAHIFFGLRDNLFLPVVYGDKSLIDLARRTWVERVAHYGLARRTWPLVRMGYTEALDIEPEHSPYEPRIMEWLSRNRSKPISRKEVRPALRERMGRTALPPFRIMRKIYLPILLGCVFLATVDSHGNHLDRKILHAA